MLGSNFYLMIKCQALFFIDLRGCQNGCKIRSYGLKFFDTPIGR